MWKKRKSPLSTGNTRAIGNKYEQDALTYLVGRGLIHVASNITYTCGELDLIMMDLECLVFVEVRFRQSNLYGGAAASVEQHKQRKLKKAAQCYLQSKHPAFQPPCRFDVIAIESSTEEHQIQWIKNAFY